MKYKDLIYYIEKDFVGILSSIYDGEKIAQIRLSKDLFNDFRKELCESYFETDDEFYYNKIRFVESKGLKDRYAIIDIIGRTFGYGYDVLSEKERIIKTLIE